MKTAMVRHGILSVPGVAAVAGHTAAFTAGIAPVHLAPQLVDLSAYGLTVSHVNVVTASQTKRFGIAGAAPTTGDAQSTSGVHAAVGFFEDLIRRGRLDHGGFGSQRAMVWDSRTLKTHKLVDEGGTVTLRRILGIDYGLRARSQSGPRPCLTCASERPA